MPEYAGGLELIWVNASPTGPTKDDQADPTKHQVVRVPQGLSKTISRSSSSDTAALVNDFSDKILFPLAKVVSRGHARIEWVNGEPAIRNLGSTHGTHVARRNATFSSSGQAIEGTPSAPFKPVEGILTLAPGDLVEFGKTCLRSDSQHYPVRCYIRDIPRKSSPASSSLASTVPTRLSRGGYSLPDDNLDSESDIISIDEATFHSSPSRLTPPSLRTTPMSAAPAAVSMTQATVVDLSGDDDDDDDDDEDEDVVVPGRTFSSSESDYDDDIVKGFSDSDSDVAADFAGASDICWRRLSQPVVVEDDVAIHSAPDVVGADGSVSASSGSKLSHLGVDAGTPAVCEKTLSEDPIVPTVGDDGKIRTLSISTPTPEPGSANLTRTVSLPEKGNNVDTMKRKLVTSDDEDADDMVATDSSVSSQAYTLSALSTPCTSDAGSTSVSPSPEPSPSPSPSKRRRKSPRHEEEVGRPVVGSPRRRYIKSLVASALYTTSLLSIGFMSGSFFTFKSMLSAAAAANAADSTK